MCGAIPGGSMIIRSEQMRIFEQRAWEQFEEEMMAHSKDFSPRLCEVIGDVQLRLAVHSAIARAVDYGFTNRGPIRLFVEMMFLCGSSFDTDPQYSPVGEALRSDGDQMLRAQQIHDLHNTYLENVSGVGAVNVHRALRALLTFVRAPLSVSADDLQAGMMREMQHIFPEKTAFVPAQGLSALIDEGTAEARHYRFEGVRPGVLLVVLKFAFGHGCTDDPLYPWIARTLKDQRIVSPEARAVRLEKKAVTWLKHVIANNEERGSQP
jgi:hypothetical protein